MRGKLVVEKRIELRVEYPTGEVQTIWNYGSRVPTTPIDAHREVLRIISPNESIGHTVKDALEAAKQLELF